MFDPVKELGLGGGSRFWVGVAAVIALLVGGGTLYKNLSFLAEARIVEGRVVAALPGDLSDVQHGRHTYQVEYPGEQGPSSHAIQTSTRREVGDRMVVGYLPSNPYAVREAGFGRMFLFPLLMLVGGTVLGALATLSLWRRLWERSFGEDDGAYGRQSSSRARTFSEGGRAVETTVKVIETTEEIFSCPGCGCEVTVKDHAATACSGCGTVWTGIPEDYACLVEPAVATGSDGASLPVYDPERAAPFIHQRLPRYTASMDEVRRILDLEAEYQESIGLTGEGPSHEEAEPTLDTTEMAAWICREAAHRGPPIAGASVVAVLDAELAYLESIGAVDSGED